jgi:hypothetical protein
LNQEINVSEKKKSKFKIKPYARAGNYKSTPEDGVKVKGNFW